MFFPPAAILADRTAPLCSCLRLFQHPARSIPPDPEVHRQLCPAALPSGVTATPRSTPAVSTVRSLFI